jgi:hypothetical protein
VDLHRPNEQLEQRHQAPRRGQGPAHAVKHGEGQGGGGGDEGHVAVEGGQAAVQGQATQEEADGVGDERHNEDALGLGWSVAVRVRKEQVGKVGLEA